MFFLRFHQGPYESSFILPPEQFLAFYALAVVVRCIHRFWIRLSIVLASQLEVASRAAAGTGSPGSAGELTEERRVHLVVDERNAGLVGEADDKMLELNTPTMVSR